MTDDQLAAVISFGVPAILYVLFLVGYRLGARKATKAIQEAIDKQRTSRIERWTPPPPQPSGEPGTPRRLLSDYEDAIYLEARHALAAQFANGDEHDHVALAAQLHADVRRLRGRILDEIGGASSQRAPASADAN
ncbi:MAG TPA: hypothetical protein VF165_00125 [Nocardioidaceae bacterium]